MACPVPALHGCPLVMLGVLETRKKMELPLHSTLYTLPTLPSLTSLRYLFIFFIFLLSSSLSHARADVFVIPTVSCLLVLYIHHHQIVCCYYCCCCCRCRCRM
ncbi:hypothetical protein F5X98DRAFT_355986 [Xylaria grammica]|nr:hypothetical protein F5X98DRAFT_355986 [Xylaria grammica]